MKTLHMSTENNSTNVEVVIVFCRYKMVNGKRVYPKKAKAFRMEFPKKTI